MGLDGQCCPTLVTGPPIRAWEKYCWLLLFLFKDQNSCEKRTQNCCIRKLREHNWPFGPSNDQNINWTDSFYIWLYWALLIEHFAFVFVLLQVCYKYVFSFYISPWVRSSLLLLQSFLWEDDPSSFLLAHPKYNFCLHQHLERLQSLVWTSVFLGGAQLRKWSR